MQSEDDSLWESFPQILEMLDGVKDTLMPSELCCRSSTT